MSTEAAQQVLDSAVDTVGISTVTSTRTTAAPRQGSIYHPDTLAAGIPVWFHRLQTGEYVALFRERWYGALVSQAGPQAYSSYSTTGTPSWTTIDPTTGVSDGSSDIPTNESGTRVLNAAASRLDYLFTIGTLDGVPFIQHHRVTELGQILLQAEEVVPPLGTSQVSYSAGVFIDAQYLTVFGTDDTSCVYIARKPWGRIGVSTDTDSPWEYKNDRGWYTDPDKATRLTDRKGEPLRTTGVVTYATRRDRQYITTQTATTTEIWSSRRVETAWAPVVVDPIVCDTLALQPQLDVPVEKVLPGFGAAIPYLTTTWVADPGAQSQVVAWGLLQV